jgi:predicted nucleic acid-binding protein
MESGAPGMPRRRPAGRLSCFFANFFAAVPTYPVTFEIARRAARIDAETRKSGVVIPFQDLVIGVTALEFNDAVATLNVRHFRMIPDLVVTAL